MTLDTLLAKFRAGAITLEELARQCVQLGYNSGMADAVRDPTGWNSR